MIEKIIVISLAVMIICLIVGSIFLPSCKELGGRSVFSHYQTIFNGKTTSLIPIYKCEMEKLK